MNTKYETKKFKQGFNLVIGCDEVGRGSLAGPVVAGAIIFDCSKLSRIDQKLFKEIKDSKLLSAKKREELAKIIKENFSWAIGLASEKEIDKINVHHATLLAMKRAVSKLLCHCEECSRLQIRRSFSEGGRSNPKQSRDCHTLGCTRVRNNKNIILLIDGKFTIPSLNIPQEAIVDGDAKIFSIAAASIVAKVYRDELMTKLDKKYPEYGFGQNKGYGTLHHRKNIKKNGVSKVHRKSFCKNIVI